MLYSAHFLNGVPEQKKRILAVAGRCRLSLTGRRSVRRGPPAQAGEAVPCRPAFSAARPSRACGGEAQLCRRLLCRPVQAADGGRRGPQPSRADGGEAIGRWIDGFNGQDLLDLTL